MYKLVVILLLITLFVNYREGVVFKHCASCENSVIHMIDVPLFSEGFVTRVYSTCKTQGIVLNPTRNFNSAKGTKANYFQLKTQVDVNGVLTDDLLNRCCQILRTKVHYGSVTNRYRVFARIYEDNNDNLAWHYDNNFTNGKRYTLVIPIYYSDCNTSQFMIRDRKDATERIIDVPIGKGVLYDGSDVYHRITNQTRGCTRIVLIVPLYENESKSFLGTVRESVRDLTYKVMTL